MFPQVQGLNRTIVELKLILDVYRVDTVLGLNRTIVELKFEIVIIKCCKFTSLNRTIVELKYPALSRIIYLSTGS